MVEKVMEDYLLWERPDTGAGEEHEDIGAAGMKCQKLIATPIAWPSAPPGGREETEESGTKK